MVVKPRLVIRDSGFGVRVRVVHRHLLFTNLESRIPNIGSQIPNPGSKGDQ